MRNNINTFAGVAHEKAQMLQHSPWSFFIGSMLAGAYVGIGIIFIFTVSNPLPADVQTLVLGATFAVALTLVVIAGAELFTGYTLYMTIGMAKKTVNIRQLLATWVVCWIGNLCGALVLVAIYLLAKGYLFSHAELITQVALKKIHATPLQLIAKGALCNWLVCLAIWMSKKVDSDIARLVVIFWCLFVFIASGFEHSIANMTLLTITYFIDSNVVGLTDIGYNLSFVTLGNIIGGAIFVALAYKTYATTTKAATTKVKTNTTTIE
ncbi:formate/nitrite transporter family protein [Shewanella gaetbuli]|uniref:Formate/nitrite transporter family protein n=1 Tax=Shewanella gaetbuli TaxID=220752 RepID=A0A9X1ZUE5_9GAMM|nr:formate/nitrite transporter family protein [Shewanella gaetbuli]MCL1142446.1 formate/nitrite transporter family protein [Shewanella gaetbuli]